MSQSTIVTIIEKYSTGILSADEERLLNDWLEGVSPEEFHRTLDACAVLPAGLREYHTLSPEFARALEHAVDEADGQDKTVPVRLFQWKKWTTVAASIIVLLSAGTWLRLSHKAAPAVQVAIHNDVAPGINGAILTLGDGRQIVLDSTNSGFSTTEGNARITKGSKDQLTYKTAPGTPAAGKPIAGTSAASTPAEMVYNTLSTPRGRKISVVLADGTKVWLNAASSIKYPTVFAGKERLVEISGEAYFEVAGDVTKPFTVKKMGSNYAVQVLGTHFNVNAYDDEEVIKTTLLEGAVRIRNKTVNHILKPGQQAVVGKDQDEITIVPDINTSEVMAWKNGLFNFDRADIYTVMRQIGRWYDVDIEYKGRITRHFGGSISQDVNVSQVFKMLELTGAVRFSIEGRKIIVTP